MRRNFNGLSVIHEGCHCRRTGCASEQKTLEGTFRFDFWSSERSGYLIRNNNQIEKKCGPPTTD